MINIFLDGSKDGLFVNFSIITLKKTKLGFVIVQLTFGFEIIIYILSICHNSQKHSIILIRGDGLKFTQYEILYCSRTLDTVGRQQGCSSNLPHLLRYLN